MPRPKSKAELIETANNNYNALINLINSMSEKALLSEFDFSDDIKKKEAHWRRDKNLRDIIIHLYEWHLLLLKWVEKNMTGNKSHFLPEPYTWKTYGKMNEELWEKHQTTELVKAQEILNQSHKDVMNMIAGFSDEELFSKNFFDWTGTTTLGSYCISATSSHYDWATKKLRAHIKKFK